MKKYLAILCATMLCVCCLALAACGGGSGGSSSSSSAAKDPTANFVGDWKIAAFEYQGLTAAGNLSAIMGGESSLSVKSDGTGKLVLSGNETDFKWKLKDDNTITVTPTTEGATSIDAKYADGAITMEVTENDVSGKVYFTKDGTIDSVTIIDPAKAQPITNESDLVGQWKMTGIVMDGVSMTGDADALASMANFGADGTTLTFEAGGKGKLAGQDVTYTVNADGTVLNASSLTFPLTKANSALLVDLSSVMAGQNMVLVYTK